MFIKIIVCEAALAGSVILPDKKISYMWKSHFCDVYVYCKVYNNSKLFVLWGIRVGFVSSTTPYALPRVCLHQPLPLTNSFRPGRPTVVSRSRSSRAPVWIYVIVTGSITALKRCNLICNNKNKLARCCLHTECTYNSATQSGHTWVKHACTQNTHVHTVSLQFVS